MIIVVDSFSTDNTVKICTQYTDKVFLNKFSGYGHQKNFAAGKTKNSWILSIDADEIVSPDLKVAIEGVLINPYFDAYKISRKNFFGKTWVKYGGWFPDYITRLYDKNKTQYNESMVHESIQNNGKTGKAGGEIWHYSYKDISDYINRMDVYSYLGALDLFKANKKTFWSDLIFRPIFTFLNLGILEGWLGFRLALLAGFYTYLKYEKLRELKTRG
jgi:glycosyltransferase involved in cell wall biosynthesis